MDIKQQFLDYKDQYKGKTCFIFGNGPSLTPDLVGRVAGLGCPIIAVNGFCMMFDKTTVRPDFVCMSNFDAIQRYSQYYSKDIVKFFQAGWREQCGVAVDTVIDLPFSCAHGDGIHGAPFIKDGHFSFDPGKENFCGDSVLLEFALPIAVYMGFKNIFFAGADCDYSKGHFSPAYPVSAKPWLRGMVNNDFSIIIPSFKYAVDLLTKRGHGIYKVTPCSRLDFIPDRTIEDIQL